MHYNQKKIKFGYVLKNIHYCVFIYVFQLYVVIKKENKHK